MTTDRLPSPRTIRVLRKLTPGEGVALERFQAARTGHRWSLRNGELTQAEFLARWRGALDALAGAAAGSPVFDVIVRSEFGNFYRASADLNRRATETARRNQATYRKEAS